MLTDKDIAALNNCLLGTHLLLEIELNVVTEESSNLRSRLHSGDDLTCSELMALPYSESLIVKKNNRYKRYSVVNGLRHC